MNIKQIRELAAILSDNGLTELEIVEGENRVYLAKQPAPLASAGAPDAPAPAPPAPPLSAAIQPSLDDPGVDFNRAIEVKSSLIGVFYASPSPDAQPFVGVGSKVRKGDVLCIIEAMKLMNEIVADQDGEIVDVCVANGDVVEFGQTLFKMC